MRTMPWLVSVRVSTAPSSTASQKLGQPVPDSYLVSDENRARVAHHAAVDAVVVAVPVGAGEGPLGAGLLGDLVLQRAEAPAQLRVALGGIGGQGVGHGGSFPSVAGGRGPG